MRKEVLQYFTHNGYIDGKKQRGKLYITYVTRFYKWMTEEGLAVIAK